MLRNLLQIECADRLTSTFHFCNTENAASLVEISVEKKIVFIIMIVTKH